MVAYLPRDIFYQDVVTLKQYLQILKFAFPVGRCLTIVKKIEGIRNT